MIELIVLAFWCITLLFCVSPTPLISAKRQELVETKKGIKRRMTIVLGQKHLDVDPYLQDV